jgi:hypothetical protein
MPEINMLIEDLKRAVKRHFNPKYDWKTFFEAFGWIKTYSSSVCKVEEGEFPAVTIVFKNQYRAKCFIYWLQVLGGVDTYQATVYLEEDVREIYQKVK